MKKKVNSKVELAKAIINLIVCFNDKHLSETETMVLAYFMVYGVTTQTKNLIVKSGVCKNLANIKTIMVKLKKYEYIYKDDLNGKVYVNRIFNFELTPTVAFYLNIESN